jgi:uncharacterized membrane protein YphA (DoxX/SURF4 family)
MQFARAAHRWLLTLFLVAVAVQFFLAGLGAFKVQQASDHGSVGEKQFADYFSPHRANVTVLSLLAILVFIAALVGRMGKRWIFVSLSLPILVELQYLFANNGPSWFRALHVVNALVIAGIAGMFTSIAWKEHRSESAAKS